MNFTDSSFNVTVRDEGEGIKKFPGPPDINEKIEKEEPPGGLGVFLIKELVDQVEFNQMTSEGHEVRMVLKLTD